MSTTRDHVIPRGLYPDSRRGSKFKPLTVPCCATCNASHSADEQEFILTVAAHQNRTPEAEELAKGRNVRALAKDQRLRREILSRFGQSDVTTPGGIWIGRAVTLKLPSGMRRVLEKIARGLFFHHTKSIMPSKMTMQWYDWMDSRIQESLAPFVKEYGRFGHFDSTVFQYLYTLPSGSITGNSIWIMQFLRGGTFAVLLQTPKI